MFGLTKREQRWKADQEAATLLVALVSTAIKARAEMDVAESNAKAAADSLELEQLRAENLRLKAELEDNHSIEVLQYRTSEMSVKQIMELADSFAEYKDHSEYVHSRTALLKAVTEKQEEIDRLTKSRTQLIAASAEDLQRQSAHVSASMCNAGPVTKVAAV